jgi:hypothetical protein
MGFRDIQRISRVDVSVARLSLECSATMPCAGASGTPPGPQRPTAPCLPPRSPARRGWATRFAAAPWRRWTTAIERRVWVDTIRRVARCSGGVRRVCVPTGSVRAAAWGRRSCGQGRGCRAEGCSYGAAGRCRRWSRQARAATATAAAQGRTVPTLRAVKLVPELLFAALQRCAGLILHRHLPM